MNDSLRTTVICHDPGDDSGDLIVDLSLDVLLRMNISLGELDCPRHRRHLQPML